MPSSCVNNAGWKSERLLETGLPFFQALGPILIYRYVEILNFMSAHLVMSLRMQEPLALVRVYIFESRECCRGCKVLCSVHAQSP